ncbi:MAG: hypothetical protein WBA67_04020 [Jannaschia sp.]
MHSQFLKTIALGLTLVVGTGLSATAQERFPDLMVRTPIEDAPFAPLFPGVEAYTLYGGFGQGIPTAILSRTDPGQSMAIPHTHTDGYWGFVIAGRHQHWEMSEPDQGPILTAGSSWYQPADMPHADLCIGPEPCINLVVFDERADFIPVQ